jgi:pimeloyl-ACP methyl ester carboxylesterase
MDATNPAARVAGDAPPPVAPRPAPPPPEDVARLFLATRLRPPPRDDAGLLARAERFTVAGLAAYAWGAGPTVLLVHGWHGAPAQWSAWVDALVAAGRRAVAVDLPAHGANAGEEANVFITTEAILRVADALAPTAIVGHSMGGYAAARWLLDRRPRARGALLAPMASVSEAIARFGRAIGYDAAQVVAFRRAVETRVGVPAAALDLAPRLASAAANGAGPRAEALVIAHDTADVEVPIDDARAIAAGFPGATLMPVSGLGHRRIVRDLAVRDAALSVLLT